MVWQDPECLEGTVGSGGLEGTEGKNTISPICYLNSVFVLNPFGALGGKP